MYKRQAYKYTIEGSPDGKSYKMLVDGRTNWLVGFLILNVEDPTAYRYYVYASMVLSMYIKVIPQCGLTAFTGYEQKERSER